MQAEMDLRLARLQRAAFVTGLVAGALVALGAWLDTGQFFRSYLMSWLLWLAVALGSLSLEMLQYLTGGRWGISVERILEASSRTLPVVAILFVPILFGLSSLYPWTHADIVAANPVLQHKHSYLNVPFFLLRSALYFVLWAGLAHVLHRHAAEQRDPLHYRAVRRISAVGLILYVFTLTFAAIDWAQSLQPQWYSTMWGFLFVAQHGLSAIAFTTLAAVLLSRDAEYAALFTSDRLHELGKLLLMFVMLWAYFSFSQFLIIWAGDLPEEIPWYMERMATNWGWVAILLIVLQFCVPFLILLSRRAKRTARVMVAVSAGMLLMRQIDLFWIVAPDVFRTGFHLHWLDVVTPLAVSALWLGSFVWQIRKRSLLPDNDPRLEEFFAHAG